MSTEMLQETEETEDNAYSQNAQRKIKVPARSIVIYEEEKVAFSSWL